MTYAPFAFSAGLLVGALALMAPLSLNAQTAPTCTLVANPAVVVPGRGFTLSIISTGATSATINNGIGSIAPNGSRQSVSIAQTTTYTATVTGAGGSATCTTTVLVDGTSGGFGTDAVGGTGDSGGSGGGGGGTDPSKILQGLGQLLGGLGQLQNSLGGNNAQNAACMPRVQIDGCGCNRSMGPNGCRPDPTNKQLCVCTNSTAGFTSVGQCMATGQCLGQQSGGGSGQQGGGMQGLGGGLQALGSILQGLSSLMGGGGGGGSGGGGAGGGGDYQYPGGGCSQYYYTATTTSDPCAIYQPNYSDYYSNNPNVSDSLFDDYDYPLIPVAPTPISDLLNIGGGSGAPGSGTGGATVDEGDKEKTLLDNLQKGFSRVAGLFSGDTLAAACRTRPWAGGGVIAGVAPDSFFDDLCRRAGYSGSFGSGTGGTSSFGSGGTTGFESGTTTNIATPSAEIRAEPAAVRLGTRTYIFWTSGYVVSCSVRGPSFEQNTLFGAGATVPITGPTTFTISCIAPDGTMVSDSVTVNLAI